MVAPLGACAPALPKKKMCPLEEAHVAQGAAGARAKAFPGTGNLDLWLHPAGLPISFPGHLLSSINPRGSKKPKVPLQKPGSPKSLVGQSNALSQNPVKSLSHILFLSYFLQDLGPVSLKSWSV